MDNKKRQDDYLSLSEYKGHKPSDKNADFLIFSKDGEHYFGMLDKNGDVALRSEGYSSEAARDNGIESVIKNRTLEERFSISEKMKHFFISLKAGNHQEIAKSGALKSKAEAESYLAFLLGKSQSFAAAGSKSNAGVAAKGATAAAGAITGRIISVKRNQIGETRNLLSETRNQIGESRKQIGENRRQIGETRNLVNTNERVTKYASVAAASLGAMSFAGMSKIETGGGQKIKKTAPAKVGGWWPLLLFLLPLLLFIGCPPVIVPPAAIAWKAVPVVVPVTTCDCDALTHPIFKIPNEEPPKSTYMLGRAPEYGDSHGLTPTQFYNKLKNKYDGSADERRFLDGIFKQMGYENGFKDATASLFTEVTIPQGINANLGTKPTHKTVYRKMETKGRDREAFRIKAKNFCDFHFMKTCGNHMYYRENCTVDAE
jgi:uncharacterized protein YegP (UPF0339 family)